MDSAVNLTLDVGGQTHQAKGQRVVFSPYRCFRFDGSHDEAQCVAALASYLMLQPGLAFGGTGKLLDALLAARPMLGQHAVALLLPDATSSDDTHGLAAHPLDSVPSDVQTVFIPALRAVDCLSLRQRIPEGVRIIDAGILAELMPDDVPARAWVPVARNIYPIVLPEVRFKEGLDLLLLDCPARNLALMPNGVGYVSSALKRSSVNYQIFDLDIVTYHRYHIHRIFDLGGKVVLPSGREMPTDPWQAEHYDLWASDDVIDYFMPIIEEAARAVVAARPKVLGLSIQQCSERYSAALVERVLDALPDTVILVGGFSCYNADIGLRSFPLADYMCIGEADLTVGPLVEALARGERPRDAAGVISRFDTPGRMFVPAPMPHNLDTIEFPRYEWFDLSIYRNYNGYQLVPVIASRGCRWSRCTFCAERFYWRIRSAKNFVDELEWLVDQGCTLFMFNESDLNGQPEKVLEICDEIIRRGLKVKLTGQLRIHKKSDRAYFQKLRAAGFVALRFGVDAFSENTLRLQMKGYTTATVSQNLKDCWESGIFTEVNWVIGVPGETEADCEEGVELILKNRNYIGRLANINPLIMVNGGVYWIDPDSHNIRFREPKEAVYKAFPRALPADKWYSVEPYIDAQVRKQRFERIVLRLYDAGFPVGAWATRIIEDVRLARDAMRSGGQAAATANTASLVNELPTHRIYRYRDLFYAVPVALGEPDFDVQDVAVLPGVVVDGSEPSLMTEIRVSVQWADSRGHYEVQKQRAGEHSDGVSARTENQTADETVDWRIDYEAQRRQRVAGSYMRVSSAATEIEHGDPFIDDARLLRNADAMFAVPLRALADFAGRTDIRVHHAVSEGATPDPLTTIGTYNLVEYDGTYYGIPQGVPVDWDDLDSLSADTIFKHSSAKDLIERVKSVTGRTVDLNQADSRQRGSGPAAFISHVPQLLKSVSGYNIVTYEGWVYGIPQSLGPIDLEQVDIMEWPDVIRDVSEDVVEGEILARVDSSSSGKKLLQKLTAFVS